MNFTGRSWLIRTIIVASAAMLARSHSSASSTAFILPTSTSAASQNQAVAFAPRPKSVVEVQRQQYQNRKREQGSQVLFMGWGPEPVWSEATVKSNTEACTSGACVEMVVSVPPETIQEYKIPGQYVQIRLDESTKPLFLAIASPPGKNVENAEFEFLIKKTEGNEWMTSLKKGDKIEVSQVLGNGFPISENLDGYKYDFPTQQVLLFAAGSGIAPIKAALESGQLSLAGDGGNNPLSGGRTARLYYGERTADDLCFVEKFPEWEALGIEVVPVLSQPSDDSWEGRTGYIQNALEEDGIAIPRNSGALLCGMKAMTESVKSLLEKAGVFDGRIIFNF